MKTVKFAVVISICCLLFSCYHTEDNPSRPHYYTKCFFLGEKSFTLEGENYCGDNEGDGEPTPFESVIVRIRPNVRYHYNDSYIELYEEWEIPGIILSKKRFRVEIDKTASGLTIDKDKIKDCFSEPHKPYFLREDLPDNFFVAELMFCFNGETYTVRSPYFREPINAKYNTKYKYEYYYCDYVFVAEPIDLSGKIIEEGKDMMFGYYVRTYHNDLNFSKPGWYKVITNYHSKFSNDSKFSSSKNNYFYLSLN
jgi:hypothetical protein